MAGNPLQYSFSFFNLEQILFIYLPIFISWRLITLQYCSGFVIHCGRRRGWDVSREQHRNMYIIWGETTPVFLPGKSHGQRSLAGYSR